MTLAQKLVLTMQTLRVVLCFTFVIGMIGFAWIIESPMQAFRTTVLLSCGFGFGFLAHR